MASSSDDGLDNTIRVYKALDESMWIKHREDTDESCEEAAHIARTLLANADLPLVFRARACMILGCSQQDDYLYWAREGVRTVEIGIQEIKGKGEEPTKRELQLLENCKKTLSDAEADFAQQEEVEEDEEVEDEEEEGDLQEGDLLWTPEAGWSDGTPDGIERAPILKGVSMADRLAIQEAARFGAAGIATPSVSRTTSGDPSHARQTGATSLVTPAVSRTTSGVLQPRVLRRPRQSQTGNAIAEEEGEEGNDDDQMKEEAEDKSGMYIGSEADGFTW